MPIAVWNPTRFYDPFIDGEAIRFSGISDRGGEYWIREPIASGGRSRREQRERALELIEMAIEQGCEPGEVVAA